MEEQKSKGIVSYEALDGSQMKLTLNAIRRDIITGGGIVEDGEIRKFIALCKARRLNPYTKEAYLVAYNGKASVIVSKDFFVKVARQTETCDGWETGVIVWNKKEGSLVKREGSLYSKTNEILVGAYARVFDKRFSHPTYVEVALEEYDKGKSLWKDKPVTMLRKVALVQALRETYPESYAGLYDADEMPAPDAPSPSYEVQVEEIDETPEVNPETGEIIETPDEVTF